MILPRRLLAHRVVHMGQLYGLSIVDITGDDVVVEAFSVETAGTAFVDGTVYMLAEGSTPENPVWTQRSADVRLWVK